MELTHRRSDYFDNEKDEFHMAVISRSTYEKINTKFTLVLKNHIKMDSGKTEESTFHKLFTRFEVNSSMKTHYGTSITRELKDTKHPSLTFATTSFSASEIS